MQTERLAGWVPTRLYWEEAQPLLDWCYLGQTRFTEPFFDQTILRCFRHPFRVLFRHQTPITALAELQATQPGIPPSGFIFHMSRCGSTLLAQMLAALPQTIMISEASPIDMVLRAHLHDASISDDQRVAWLQWMVNALGQPRAGVERQLVIKFDSWHAQFLPIIQRAFPDVPRIFLYRDPVEVMVSHQRGRGSQMVPGMLPPALFGLDADMIFQMPLDEYCARVLASICEAAVQHHQPGHDRLVHYRQLPQVAWSSLLDLFRIEHTADDIERMRSVTQFHAKNPSFFFVDDVQDKRQAATADLRALADRLVRPHYERLGALQQAEATGA